MSKKLKTALFLGSLLFLVYVFFQHPGFQGYEDETYRRIWDNLASGEFRAARSGYAQIVLETPFVWAGKVAGMFFGANAESAAQLFANFYSPFISALSVAVFFLLVNLFAPRKRAFGVALAFGLLTMTFPYALIGMEPTAVFFLVTAVYFLFKFGQNKNKAHLVLSGLFYFLLFFSKAYYFVTIPAFLIYIFLAQNLKFKIQDLKNFVKGCLLFFSPLLVIFPLYFFANKYNFGVFFGGAYNLRVELLGGDNILFGLYGLLLSFGKSIFVYNPILLLSLFFVGSFYRKFQKEAVFLTIFSLLLLLFVSWTHWWSDETWGPRYLIAFIFPLMIPLALFRKKLLGFQTFKKVAFTVFFSIAITGSVLMQFLGTLSRYDVFPYTFFEIFRQTGYNVVASQEYQFIPQFAPYLVNYHYLKNKITGQDDPLVYRILYTPPMAVGSGAPDKLVKEIVYTDQKYQNHVLDFWWAKVPHRPPSRFLFGFSLIFLVLFWRGRKLLRSDANG